VTLMRDPKMSTEGKATETVKKRYNRIAPLYDRMEGLVERSRYSKWRDLLWSKIEGTRILEVGVGTGKNFPYYPADADITAVDFSEKMLERAKRKANKQKIKVLLQQMDVQKLDFPNNSFDSVVGSFVFCSVPDPVRGLKEIERVCKAGGKVVLMEHVLSANRVLGWLMNLANPLSVWMVGADINRRTVDNVRKSGLEVEQVTDLAFGIFKLIEARKKA
jgi:phosphatidylethanolamine/phosphatidyl-N-methylethanolamine N-methyltransferase